MAIKKIISTLLMATLLVTAFSSCKNSDGSSDWEYIENKGEMIIGITYFEPMNYFDENNNLIGFETEFAEALCEILGVTPKFQEISWTAKETELNAKNIDCIWNGMTIDDQRKAAMSITSPYMNNRQVLITKSENAEALRTSVSGKTVVAEKTSAGETTVTENAFFSEVDYIAVDTQAKALMEVLAGTADACVVDSVLSIGMIGEGTDFSDLFIVEGGEYAEEEYGIAFRKEDTELTKKVNTAIKELIDNGELLKIAEKYKLQDLLITD